MISCGESVNKRGAQQIKKMVGESSELRNIKRRTRGERSVREKKAGAENKKQGDRTRGGQGRETRTEAEG